MPKFLGLVNPGAELLKNGIVISAVVYTFEELEDNFEFVKGNELSIVTTTGLVEVDPSSTLTPLEIQELVENNNYGSVNLGDVNLNENDVLKRLLKGKYDNSKSYNVLFFFTKKGKTVATSTKTVTGGKTGVLKADALNAAKRTAVNKMIKVMQKPLAGILESQGKTSLAKGLSTPEGKALLAGVLGTLQLMLPQLQSDEFSMIGEELRTQALSYVTDHIGDLLDPLIDAFGEAAASLPKIVP